MIEDKFDSIQAVKNLRRIRIAKLLPNEMNDFQCEKCFRHFLSRLYVHTQLDNSPKGFRYICCECLGHPPLSCKEEKVKR